DIHSKWLTRTAENYPNLNIVWLITGEGEMYHEDNTRQEPLNALYNFKNIKDHPDEEKTNISIYKLNTELSKEEKQYIPIYNIEATAGLISIFNGNNERIPVDFVSVPNAPKCDGAVFVRGDSMYPILKAGDIVCYKILHNISNIRFGEIYLLDIDDGDDQYLTIKYVQKSDLGKDYVKLVSQNSHHSPKDELLANIRAIALVKISIRYNN
ncbi:MAG: S24 family peptidase, partial [Bacteroidales bacterium]|nr:S24 family peptidase [Bacteroidales bacterium]